MVLLSISGFFFKGVGSTYMSYITYKLIMNNIFVIHLYHFRAWYTEAKGDLLENSFVSMETRLFSPGS